MSFHLLIGDRTLVSGGSARVPAAQRRAFHDAHALLAAAAQEAAAVAERAEAARAQGWRDGWEAASSRAGAEVADQVAAFAAAMAAENQRRRTEIATVALAAVEAMLGTLAPDDAAVRLAAAVVVRVPDDEQVVVACAPAVADRVRTALAGRGDVTVEAREDFAPLQVALLTAAGRIVADLDVQLAQLADRWGAAR